MYKTNLVQHTEFEHFLSFGRWGTVYFLLFIGVIVFVVAKPFSVTFCRTNKSQHSEKWAAETLIESDICKITL